MGLARPGGSLAPDRPLGREGEGVREFSTPMSGPLAAGVPATGNLTDDVVRNAAEAPDAVVLSRRAAGRRSGTT